MTPVVDYPIDLLTLLIRGRQYESKMENEFFFTIRFSSRELAFNSILKITEDYCKIKEITVPYRKIRNYLEKISENNDHINADQQKLELPGFSIQLDYDNTLILTLKLPTLGD